MKLREIFRKFSKCIPPEGYFTHRLYELLSLFVSIAGFVAIYITINENKQAIHSNIDLNMNSWSFETDKVFIEHPQYRGLFFDTIAVYSDSASKNKDVGIKRHEGSKHTIVVDTVYDKVVSISDLLADCFDGILSNREYFTDKQKRIYWIRWIYDSFTRSPILCKSFFQTKDWYGEEINLLFKEWDQCKPVDQVITDMQKRFYQ